MVIGDAELTQLLAELEYIAPADLKSAQERTVTDGITLYEALLKSDLVSDQDLGKLVAYSKNLPFVALSQVNIPEEILKITPRTTASDFHVITYALDEKGLKIATSEPDGNTVLYEMLAKKAGTTEYKVFFATEHDIEDGLRLYKKQLQDAFESLLTSKSGKQVEAPVAKIVDTIIEYAHMNKTSDVHIEPLKESSLIRFRIDGVLHDVVRLPKSLHAQVVARIKVLSKLRTDEHHSAQDGRMRLVFEEDVEVDVRVSIVPVVSGEKIVMRLLSSKSRQFSLTDLGMQEVDLRKVKQGFARPYGMVLSTGPTGSGKSTTMYAILKILNTREKNIATIEDPVEYEVEGLNQIQVNTKTNLTFAAGLRSILRQDPDVIYVGEIRDEETAEIAINSAMTGHLVLSTLHTNDAATALPRFIDMNIEPFLVASTVNVIIAQRLIRKICDRCKVSLELSKKKTGWDGDPKISAQLMAISPSYLIKHFGSDKLLRVYRGKGCTVCHGTGYIGRVGIFEVLEVSPLVQELITEKANSDQIMAQALKEGMTIMMDDGLAKVQRGITTIEEVLRVTQE